MGDTAGGDERSMRIPVAHGWQAVGGLFPFESLLFAAFFRDYNHNTFVIYSKWERWSVRTSSLLRVATRWRMFPSNVSSRRRVSGRLGRADLGRWLVCFQGRSASAVSRGTPAVSGTSRIRHTAPVRLLV